MQYSCHLPSPITDATPCTKTRTNPVPTTVSMYQFYPFRYLPTTGSILHCTEFSAIVHRLYTMYQNPYNGSSLHCKYVPVRSFPLRG